jgi:hypothetical protein
VVVPPYSRSRQGRLFRILRSSRFVAPDRIRFALRAQPVSANADPGVELAKEVDASFVRDKIANGQAIPTPEGTFEELWHQLLQDLEAHYG